VPESTPAGDSVTPDGNVPEASANVRIPAPPTLANVAAVIGTWRCASAAGGLTTTKPHEAAMTNVPVFEPA
jgi:hypothetical protein